MRKTLAILLMMCMLAGVAAALAEAGGAYDAYMGMWHGVSLTEDGQTYDLVAMGMNMVLELREGGIAFLTMAGEKEESTWEGGDGCIIVDGAPMTLDGDTLTMQEDGTAIIFSRQKPEGSTVDLSGYPEFLGDWFCIALTEGGETISPAAYGMEVILSLNADGSAILDMAGEKENAAWNVTEGGISLMGLPGALMEDGTLVIEEEGMGMVFSREAGAVETVPLDMTAYADYIGTWAAEAEGIAVTIHEDGTATVEAYGETVNIPLTEKYGYLCIADALLNMQYDGTLLMQDTDMDVFLTRKGAPDEPAPEPEPEPDIPAFDMTPYADYIGTWGNDTIALMITQEGTAMMMNSGDIQAFALSEQYGFLGTDSLFLLLQTDGSLSLNGGIYAVLYRDGIVPTPVPTPKPTPEPTSTPTSTPKPTPDPTPVPTVQLTPEPTPDPTPTPTPVPTPKPLSTDDFLEKRFVCVTVDMGGTRVDASAMGGEYAMVFHANGGMDFVLAGMHIDGLSWEKTAAPDGNGVQQPAFAIDYFGEKLFAVLTSDGLEMNYMDSMRLFFEIEK